MSEDNSNKPVSNPFNWTAATFTDAEDHSEETTKLLERINAESISSLLTTGEPICDFVSELLILEKKARLGGDVLSAQKLSIEAVRLYRVTHHIDAMLDCALSLMKLRMQSEQAQIAMVEECALVLEEIDETRGERREERIELLRRLKFLAETRLHLELHHARFTRDLVRLLIVNGEHIREGCDLLQEVQVETLTRMPRLEKADILLLQLELLLNLKDSERVLVTSRKFNPQPLARPDALNQKVRYFELMLEHYTRIPNSELLQARCWHEIYCATLDQNPELSSNQLNYIPPQALSNCVLFLMAAPLLTDDEIEDMEEPVAFSHQSLQKDRALWMKELLKNKHLRTELPTCQTLLRAFCSNELIHSSHKQFVISLERDQPLVQMRPELMKRILSRCSEHDVLVIARFYSRIRLSRLSELVGLSLEETEAFVMSLVLSNAVYARVDRVDGTVVFQKKANPQDVSEEWSKVITQVTGLIERASHLIAMERMIHITKRTQQRS